MRIVTWNIRHGVGSGWKPEKADIGRTVRVLSELDADIVCLQEVMSVHGRWEEENQAAFLADSCGYPCRAMGENHRWENGGFGNVTLSRVPFASQVNHDLSLSSERVPRGCLQTDVEWNGRMVHLFNLHLGLDWRERGEQLGKLVELAKVTMHVPEDVSYANAVTIFAGDFNEWIPFRLSRWADEASKEVKPKGRGRQSRGSAAKLSGYCERSIPTRFPLLSFDGLFATAPMKMRVHESETAREASDHLPIVAEIEV